VTTRDRTVLIVVAFVAILGAFWFVALTPKRKESTDASSALVLAQQRLSAAQANVSGAEAARQRYDDDYATVARLGKAVPVDDDVPSLVYQLERTAHANKIDFRSIAMVAGSSSSTTAAPPTPAAAVASANGSTASSTTPAVTTALPPGATVGAAGFPTMPFSFDFDGKFFPLQRFLRSLDDLTTVKGKSISVKGRLLTIDGVALKAGPKGFPDVSATVAVTAYLLPSDEGLTAGATATTTPAATSSATGTAPTASLIGSDR
jgi:hypothetical protein